MFRLMLNANPALICPGEADFLFDYLTPSADGWHYDRTTMAANRIYRSSPMTMPDNLDGVDALKHMVGQVRAGRHVLILHRGIKKAAEIFPKAPVVHVKRDPRDVGRSSINLGWAGNPYHGLDHWVSTETEWNEAVPDLQVAPFDLRYEELISDPESRLRALCDHLGVSYTPEMLDIDERSTYAKADASFAYQWKRKQSMRDVQRVEARLGNWLAEFGYDPSGFPSIRLSAGERLWLRLQSKFRTVRFHARRYGLALYIKSKIARIVNAPEFSKSVQRQIDEVAIRHLK